MKLSQNFSDITLLILTNNRTQTLLRNLEFINSYDYKVKIIILDSSLKKINQKLFSDFNLDIKYLYFNPTTSFHKKIYYSLKYIKSQFCLTIADDDFFFLKSVDKCIQFLRKNNKFVSANGYTFIHSDYKRTNKGLFTLYKLGGKKNKSNLGHNNVTRIKNFMNGKISQNLYAVCKTTAYKKAQSKIYYMSKGQGNGEYDELLFNILILNYGKSKFLKIPYSSREPNYGTSLLFSSKFIEDNYKKWNSKFVEIVCDLLPKKDQKMFKKYLHLIMSKRFKKLKNKFSLYNNKSLFYLFNFVKLILKNIFLTKFYPKKYLGIDLSEIEKIKKIIIKFPNVQSEIIKSRSLRKNNKLLF